MSVLQHTYKKYILFYNIMSLLYLYRFLMRLKGDVHTKSHPEGSIMEGSLFYDSLKLCARYLHDETQFSR